MKMSLELRKKVLEMVSSGHEVRGWLCKIKAPVEGPVDEVIIVSPQYPNCLLVKAKPSQEVIELLGRRKMIYAYVVAVGENYLIVDEVQNVTFD